MSIAKKVIAGLSWTAGANLISQIITWGITIVVMRILHPADYGLLAIASIFVAFLSMMAAAGLGPAIVQAKEIGPHQLKQLFGLILALNGTLMVALFLGAPTIAAFFDEPRLSGIIRVLSVQFIINAFGTIPEAMLGRDLKFKGRALIDLGANVAGGLLTLVLAYKSQGVWSLIGGTLLSVTAKAVGLNLVRPSIMMPTLSLAGTKSLLVFGGNVTAARILWFYYSQVDMFVAGKLLGKEAVGAYSVAMHLASLPVQKISGIINQVAYPAFARIQNDHRLVATHFLKGVRLLCFFAFPVLWGISSIAPELIRMMLGEKWTQASFPLQVLPTIMPLRMISGFLPSALDAVGRPDLTVRYLIVASLVMPAAFFLGSQWGIEGLCVAWVLAFPLLFLANLTQSLPAINVRLSDVGQAMIRPALCSVFMYGAIVITGHALAHHVSDGARLALMITIGTLSYVLLAITINKDGCKEIFNVIYRKR